jgi:hypothetical protein
MFKKSAAPAAGGYTIDKSLRFRSSASAYLSRTPGSAGNRTKVTLSAWVKLGALGTNAWIINAGTPSNTYADGIRFNSNSTIRLILTLDTSGSPAYAFVDTNAVFRDPSAWYHIVGVIDTTAATDTNRFKIYVSGVQQSVTGTYPSQNFNFLYLNTTNTQYIGAGISNTSLYDGYMAEVNLIDGQQLTPSSFGSFSGTGGVWQPIKYTGTYGTNGFYLKFTDTTSTTTLCYDYSGNSNNWTPNNISLTAGSTYDSMTDVPTLTSATVANYAVMNPLNKGSTVTLQDGNLTLVRTNTTGCVALSSIGMTSGKWYCEATATSSETIVGLTNGSNGEIDYVGSTSTSWGYYGNNGNKLNAGGTAYGSTYTAGDVIGIAFDADNGTLTFYKNNTSQGTAFSGLTTRPYFFAFGNGGPNGGNTTNFGQRPFAYTPPTGFVALNTYNLSTPTIAAGNQYMDATLFTSNGGVQTVTNAGSFKPDLVWSKSRSTTDGNDLNDSVRGASKYLVSFSTAAETTDANFITAFNSNGFSIGSSNYSNGQSIVGWQWQAGQGSTSSNTNGSITSNVSVSTTAGFSIVTYTGTGVVGGTVGHGLGVAPSFIVVKDRTTAGYGWLCYHSALGVNQYLSLNGIGAAASLTGVWGSAVNSTTFGVYAAVGSSNNALADSLVAYCWAAIPGFSAFGSYTGNGSTDGPFVYLGFRPKYWMIKRTDASGSWIIWDSVRTPYNPDGVYLVADGNGVEGTYNATDFVSNGLKWRANDGSINAAGGNYVYMAFAENPFKYALAR